MGRSARLGHQNSWARGYSNRASGDNFVWAFECASLTGRARPITKRMYRVLLVLLRIRTRAPASTARTGTLFAQSCPPHATANKYQGLGGVFSFPRVSLTMFLVTLAARLRRIQCVYLDVEFSIFWSRSTRAPRRGVFTLIHRVTFFFVRAGLWTSTDGISPFRGPCGHQPM